MADYRLTETDSCVIRAVDSACIPDDPANRDWIEYQEWLADGGVPDPYVAPGPISPTSEQAILFDHENRIRAQEGQPPLSMAEFITKAKP